MGPHRAPGRSRPEAEPGSVSLGPLGPARLPAPYRDQASVASAGLDPRGARPPQVEPVNPLPTPQSQWQLATGKQSPRRWRPRTAAPPPAPGTNLLQGRIHGRGSRRSPTEARSPWRYFRLPCSAAVSTLAALTSPAPAAGGAETGSSRPESPLGGEAAGVLEAGRSALCEPLQVGGSLWASVPGPPVGQP